MKMEIDVDIEELLNKAFIQYSDRSMVQMLFSVISKHDDPIGFMEKLNEKCSFIRRDK